MSRLTANIRIFYEEVGKSGFLFLKKTYNPLDNFSRNLHRHKNLFFIMSGFLYFIAIILIIAWAIGFIGYGAGWLIHILLVIAVIAILLRLIGGRPVL